MKIIFKLGFPRFSRVTIFNSEDYWLKKILFKNKKVVTIPSYPKLVIYISINFLIYFVKYFFFIRKFNLKSIRKNIYYSYIISIFDYAQTKKIITFIDNSMIFHTLSKLDRKREYFAIQNGIRGYSCVKTFLPKNYKIYLQNFFCFSEREKKLFSKFNHKIKNFIPVGSIKSSYYYEKFPDPKNKKFDICYISQLQERFFTNEYKDKYEKINFYQYKNTINLCTDYIAKYINNKSIKIAVCMRSSDSKFEYEFYKKKFKGLDVSIFKNDKEKFSSYKTVSLSKITIGHHTTMLPECYKYNKLLWYNPYNFKNFEVKEAKKCYLNSIKFIEFKNKINYLYNLDNKKYLKQSFQNSKNICYNEIDKPAHKLIIENLNNV